MPFADLRTAFAFDDTCVINAASTLATDAIVFTTMPDASDLADGLGPTNRAFFPTGFNDPQAYADHDCDYCDQPVDTLNDPIVLHCDRYGPSDLAHLACFTAAARAIAVYTDAL